MAEIGQFSGLGMYDEGGKFAVDPTAEDRLRAEAEAKGLRYSGDVGIGPKFLEFAKNIPDAGYEFFARGFEGLGELAVGTALAGYKGGKLLLEPDPEKRREIMAEPAFTKYMGEFRGKLGSLDLAENTISGITPEQIANVIGYYAGPPSSVIGGIVKAPFLAAKATQGTKAAAEGTTNIVKDVVKSFTEGDSGFRASAGGGTGVKTVDEIIDEGISPSKKYLSKDELFNSVINNQDSVKILEDVRTGKISYVDGANQIEKLIDKNLLRFPDKGAGLKGFSKDKNRDIHTQKFTELLESYKNNLKGSKNYEDDIFDVDIISKAKDSRTKKATLATPQKKKVALDALELVKKDTSSDPFGVKYRNAYKKLMLGDEAKIPDDYFKSTEYLTSETTAKNILDYQGVKVAPIKNPNTVIRSPDGTTMTMSKSKFEEGPSKSFNKIKVGEKIEGDQAKRHLKSDVMINGENQSFNQIKSSILKDEQVSSKMTTLKSFFEKGTGKEHVYSFDHIQSPKFGGGNTSDNLIFIMEGPHNSIKNLPASKTSVDNIVKPKSRFENDVHKKGLGLVDAVKKGNLDRAKELSEEINKLQSDFKKTYTSVDFVVGQPYVSVKTGDKTANTITYAENLKLTPDQIEQVNKLLPTYSNRPNAGLSVEKSIDRLVTMYGELASLKRSKLTVKEGVQASPLKDGGMVGISHLIRPL